MIAATARTIPKKNFRHTSRLQPKRALQIFRAPPRPDREPPSVFCTLPPRLAERVIWNIRPDLVHSGLMLAARITLPHFSVSSAMNLPKSAGEPASIVPPKSASRAFILGSARPALISLLSLSTISTGVFLGAPTPNHTLASYPA